MPAEVAVFGVRHHGPGSARSVAAALDVVRPAVVVIEGPPELDRVAPLAASAQLKPPVAALVYDVKEPHRASFYPMASFSPEWVALRWALERGIEVRFADLPAANRLAFPDAAGPSPDPEPGQRDDRSPVAPPRRRVTDPIAELAAAAGYDDPERWWDDAIEARAAPDDPVRRFVVVADAMAELRGGAGGAADPPSTDGPLEACREAAMRKVIRSARHGAEGPVAVVCGAYHVPALQPARWPRAADDNATLAGLPRTKVAATWAPWTSARLTASGGYGAGVTSPAWYHHLFTTEDDVIERWMVRTARLLRSEGFDAPAPSVVEASRLATSLAALRGRPLAGLAEVDDATTAVFSGGSATPLTTIRHQLLVGDELGTVPASTPQVPLADDLARQQRSLRLAVSAEPKTLDLDLRKPNQLARSVLFRRLLLLGIPWAREADAGRTLGTFKERWIVEWAPELTVAVIEASLYGTTVISATNAKVVDGARASTDLAALSALIEACLPAELPTALAEALHILADRTAHQPDLLALALTVKPLARTRRYGNVRGVDTEAVADVLGAVATRVAVGLRPACVSLDDESAAAMRGAIESVDRALALVDDGDLWARWRRALLGLTDARVHGSVMGRVTRMLLDGGGIDRAEADNRLSRALSPSADRRRGAAWLDGFLAGDVTLLLNDPDLLNIIDRWLTELAVADFDDLLPLVRRTFSRFEKAERRQLGRLLATGGGPDNDRHRPLDRDRARPAVAAVMALLGPPPQEVP